MLKTEGLIAISGLLQALYSRWQVRHLLSGLIVVVGLTIVTSFMICAALIGSFYAICLALAYYGVAPQHIFLIMIGIGALTLVLLISTTASCLRRLSGHSRPKPASHASLGTQAGDAIDAFIDGLMTGNTRE